MTAEDRRLIAETVQVMQGLKGEMQEFRGEMKEFKTQTLHRITALEESQNDCQKNPTVCATARALESHTRTNANGKTLAVSVWAACVSTAMCALSFIVTFIKRS